MLVKKNVNEPNDGNRDEVFQRHRPLRVVLENEEVKWKMVKSAPEIKKVKDAATFKAHEVFITPDNTILQKEKELQARQELKTKRAVDPNGGWKMGYNFKLVKRPVPQPTSQS